MRAWWLAWGLALSGSACRLGFDMTDPAPLEAGVTMTATWGEDTNAVHQDVTADTYVSGKAEVGEEEIDLNFGASTRLDLGESDAIALVRFDLAALPAGTRVVSASLRLVLSNAQHGAITLHRLNEAWAEGTGNGMVGAASWLERLAGTPWTSAGVGAPASRESDAAATIPESVSGEQLVDLPAALVEGWIDSPPTNHGLALVVGNADDTRITSREGTDGARPLLSITYVP